MNSSELYSVFSLFLLFLFPVCFADTWALRPHTSAGSTHTAFASADASAFRSSSCLLSCWHVPCVLLG